MERRTIAFWMMVAAVVLMWYAYNQPVDYKSVTFFRNETVYIKESVYEHLQTLYNESVVEDAYCLWGTNNNNIIIIKNITRPTINAATDMGINYDTDDCKGSLGVIHFHLQSMFASCNPSSQDVYGYGWMSANYPEMKVHMVLCNQSYFVFKPGNIINTDSLKLTVWY
jgi:hypothetical protein